MDTLSKNAIILLGGNHYGQKKNYNWNKIRKEFQESDLTYSTFSTQKGIPKSTAYAHLKDLIAIKNSSNGVEINNKDTETFDFVPIEDLEAEAAAATDEVTFIQTPEELPGSTMKVASSPIEIKIKGCSIALNQGFDKGTLKDAFEVLTALC